MMATAVDVVMNVAVMMMAVMPLMMFAFALGLFWSSSVRAL